MSKYRLCLAIVIFLLTGCSGMKVIHPNDENKNSGTKMLDLSGGMPKIVSTYTCKLQSMGQRVSAIGKTEKEARAEVLEKCHDKTLVSFCKEDKITCTQN
ncbi:MAG: hypothetical protein IPK68_01210 [Bdellovibrionales bacterium]|nr:hypothetical protein [Bdellovibrionales bacterium]